MFDSYFYVKIKTYTLNLLLALDHLLNVVFCGNVHETISSRIGRLKLKNNGVIPWSSPLAKSIDFMLELIDKNHCIDAIERKEVIEDAETLSDEKREKS